MYDPLNPCTLIHYVVILYPLSFVLHLAQVINAVLEMWRHNGLLCDSESDTLVLSTYVIPELRLAKGDGRPLSRFVRFLKVLSVLIFSTDVSAYMCIFLRLCLPLLVCTTAEGVHHWQAGVLKTISVSYALEHALGAGGGDL